MKRVNPLSLLFILISIVIFLSALKHKGMQSQKYIVSQINQETSLAKEIVGYKNMWENRKFYKKNLRRFIKSLNNRRIKYTKKESGEYINFHFENIKPINAKYVLSMLLNQNFKIESLTINRVDKSHIEIDAKVGR